MSYLVKRCVHPREAVGRTTGIRSAVHAYSERQAQLAGYLPLILYVGAEVIQLHLDRTQIAKVRAVIGTAGPVGREGSSVYELARGVDGQQAASSGQSGIVADQITAVV